MAKKTPKNRYGINIGDIFVEEHTMEDNNRYNFYQVVALRGELTVVVKRICTKTIAFDGRYESVAPILDNWVTDEEFVRRVQEYDSFGKRILYIKIRDCIGLSADLITEDDKDKMYLEWSGGPDWPYILKKEAPELAEQFDLNIGSGIFLIENRDQRARYINQKVLVRYPDGREEEIILKDLFTENK